MKERILVIDDNPANLDLMLYLLRAFGHTAHGASDGLAGFEAAQSGDLALVLTDVLMPGIDGYELVRRLKADTRFHGIPVVAVTALAMAGDRERIAAAGFDGYIGKPIDPERFVAQIEAYLPAKPTA
jgi:two-component system cell cycle response regulator